MHKTVIRICVILALLVGMCNFYNLFKYEIVQIKYINDDTVIPRLEDRLCSILYPVLADEKFVAFLLSEITC